MPTPRPGYVWSGTEWVPIGPTVPTSPFFFQAGEPATPASGDMWVDSDGTLQSIVLNAGDFATQAQLTAFQAKLDSIEALALLGL